MAEYYIVVGKQFLRRDDVSYFFTSDAVFENLSDAINESRKIYGKFLGFIKEDYESCYNTDEDLFEENFFVDEKNESWYNSQIGSFSIIDTEGYFVEGIIKKVSINLSDKKSEEENE